MKARRRSPGSAEPEIRDYLWKHPKSSAREISTALDMTLSLVNKYCKIIRGGPPATNTEAVEEPIDLAASHRRYVRDMALHHLKALERALLEL